MDKKLLYYLCPAMMQTAVVSVITAVLTRCGVECGYKTVTGMVLIAAGGISTALWGCLYQIKFGGKKMKRIVCDFFRMKAAPSAYLLTAAFIVLSFLDALTASPKLNMSLTALLLTFISSIAFGGIEEIGWRYTFQPELEKKLPYPAAVCVTFVCWGAWHFMFFIIDGSISAVKPLPFLLGLLMNCFMFSAIFNYSGNLWLCVLAHSLVNTFSQAMSGSSVPINIVCRVIIILMALLSVYGSARKDNSAETQEEDI